MKRVHAPALIALVGASFVVRTALAWLRATPALFPDEYIYSSLGRSLAESGRPLIRGGSAHFPALLQPILTAPAWLIGDVGVAFRVVQTISALAMSLAAIPVYLLAIRLGLSRRVALALAALAVLVPDLMYASFVTSEPFAYPLVLATVAAASFALAQPTRRTQARVHRLRGARDPHPRPARRPAGRLLPRRARHGPAASTAFGRRCANSSFRWARSSFRFWG